MGALLVEWRHGRQGAALCTHYPCARANWVTSGRRHHPSPSSLCPLPAGPWETGAPAAVHVEGAPRAGLCSAPNVPTKAQSLSGLPSVHSPCLPLGKPATPKAVRLHGAPDPGQR